jgi:translation initiation factor 5
LQDYLDGFISKFVLCKKCKNPETDVHIKDGRILLDCKACGQRSDVDLRLKLSSFILKNQPKKGKKDKADKKARKTKAKENGDADQNGNGQASGGSNSDNAEEDDGDMGIEAGSDDELTRRINADAKEIGAAPEPKEEEWAVDVSEEAVKARALELPGELKQKLGFDDADEEGDGEGAGNSAYDQLGSWVLDEAKAKGGVAKVEDVDIYVKAKELGIEAKHKALTVLAQTIFDKDIVAQIPRRASMLKKVSVRTQCAVRMLT